MKTSVLVCASIVMFSFLGLPTFGDPVLPAPPAPPAAPNAPATAPAPDPSVTDSTMDNSTPDLQPTKIDNQFYQTPNYISAMVFSHTSDHVLVGLKDGRLGFFSMTKRIFSPWSDSLNPSGIDSIALSPNGNLIAAGSSDPFVQLLNAGSFQNIKTFSIGTNDSEGVQGVAFSPDGLLLAACAEADPGDFSRPRGEVSVWSVRSGVRVCHFYTITEEPRNVAFSSDSSRLVVGGDNPTVWDVAHNKLIQVLDNKGDCPAAISPDGRYIATAVNGGIFDLKSQTLQSCALGQINTLVFTQDGRYLIGGSSMEGWGVFDTKTGKKAVDLQFPDDLGAISPDNQYIAASSDNIGLDIIKLDITGWTAATPTP